MKNIASALLTFWFATAGKKTSIYLLLLLEYYKCVYQLSSFQESCMSSITEYIAIQDDTNFSLFASFANWRKAS